MEDKNQNPLEEFYLLIFERKLFNLVINAVSSGRMIKQPTPVGTASFLKTPDNDNANEYEVGVNDVQPTSTAYFLKSANDKDIEGVFIDFDSDDSVKDKTYEPGAAEDADSSASYISDSSDSVVTQYKKLAVKRQIFSPEKPPQNEFNDLNLITPDELFGLQPQQQSLKTYLEENFADHNFSEKCTSPKRKKISIQVEANIHSFNKNTTSGQSRKTGETHQTNSKEKSSEKSVQQDENLDLITAEEDVEEAYVHSVCINHKFRDRVQRKLNLHVRKATFSYDIMTVDCNGNVYVSSNQAVSEESTPLKSKSKKKERNPLKWKRTSAKLARFNMKNESNFDNKFDFFTKRFNFTLL